MTKTDKLSQEGLEKMIEKVIRQFSPYRISELQVIYKNKEPLENMLNIHQNSPRGTIYGMEVHTDETVPDDELRIVYGSTIIKKFKI